MYRSFCLLTLLVTISAPTTAAKKPNVLLILVDDLKPALGCYGDVAARTPNIDALAANGTRFDLAYCNQAVCAPSRFTLMLGSHSTSTGLYGLGSQLRELVPNAVTMPQYFAKNGYRTESLGKVFHIGHGNLGDPGSFSVPHFKDKVIEYLDPASTDGGKLTREEALFTNQKLGQIRTLPRGAAFEAPDAADDEYADGRVAAETILRLTAAKKRRENGGSPFFITAGFVRPHLPFSAPAKYWELFDADKLPLPKSVVPPKFAPSVAIKRGGEITAYRPVPAQGEISPLLQRQLIHGYYASTAFVDAQIGKVLTALTELQLEENTIIVLWGDHGFHLGDLGIWTKHTNYEQANRIPILVVAPGVTTAGSATRQLAESVDIFPTLCDLAGLPIPAGPQPIDGKSLLPVLRDPSVRVRDHAFHAYPRAKLGRAIRTERYRMVQWLNPGEPEENAEYEVYDYQNDSVEHKNIAQERPDVLADLKKKLDGYRLPVSRSLKKQKRQTTKAKTPQIAERRISISATVRGESLNGVVVAQGGNQHGYALHFIDGTAVLDVRINGNVTRLRAQNAAAGLVKLSARIDSNQLSLTVNQSTVRTDSAGFIPVQPIDGLSVGTDTQSAAGDYHPSNDFSGQVISYSVTASKP